MRKIMIIILFLTITLLGINSSQNTAAVFNFENINTDDNTVKAIEDIFKTNLNKYNKYKVIDKNELNKVIKEFNIKNIDTINDDKAVMIGKMLDASIVIRCSVSKLGSTYTLNIKVLDVKSKKSILIGSESAAESDLPDTIAKLASQISGKKKTDTNVTISDDEIPRNGLIAEFLMDGSVYGTSENRHKIKMYGTELAKDRFGKKNATYFNGITNYIKAPKIEEKSISIWINSDSKSQCGFYEGGTTKKDNKGYTLAVIAPNGLGGANNQIIYKVAGLFVGFWNNDLFIPFDKINEGWHHICVSWDGSNIVTVYIDGKAMSGFYWNNSWSEVKDKVFNLKYAPTPSKSDESVIGKNKHEIWEKGKYNFKGTIDDVRIYNRGLSEEEVLSIYHEGGWGL